MPPNFTSASQSTASQQVGVQGGAQGSTTIGTGAGGVTATSGAVVASQGAVVNVSDAPGAINAIADTAYRALEANQNVVQSTIAAAAGSASRAFDTFAQGQAQQQTSLQDALNNAQTSAVQAATAEQASGSLMGTIQQYEPIILLVGTAATIFLLLRHKN